MSRFTFIINCPVIVAHMLQPTIHSKFWPNCGFWHTRRLAELTFYILLVFDDNFFCILPSQKKPF